MDREIQEAKEGREGYIGIKINSLTDKRIIDKLIEASEAGVQIEMVIRGINCILSGIEGEDGSYPGHQYCGPLSGAFPYLYLWNGRAGSDLYCFSGLS